MKLTTRMKWASTALLAAGFFALLAIGSADAASKAAEAKKAIADLAAAKDSRAKAEALTEIGKLAQVQKTLAEPAMADIKKCLSDSSALVRKAAATAYGRCDPDPKEAVPIFVKMLNSEKDDEVRVGIAHGLAAMGPSAKEALPTLRDAMKEEKAKAKDGKQTKLQRELGDAARAISEMKKKN